MKKHIIVLIGIIGLLTACHPKEKEHDSSAHEHQHKQDFSLGYENSTSEMEKMIEYLEKDELEYAITSFHQAHDFFHDIDPALREKDEALGEKLWNSVGIIEWEIEKEKPNTEDLIRYATETLTQFQQSKELLLK